MSRFMTVAVYRCGQGHAMSKPIPPRRQDGTEPPRAAQITCPTCEKANTLNERRGDRIVPVVALYEGDRRIKPSVLRET